MTTDAALQEREPPEALPAAGLARTDGRGIDLRRPLGLDPRELHACQQGNVTLLVLIMGIVFYVLVAMVWNTGEVTSAKIEAQTAADAAAYSSAVWTSRAMNLTTGSNMAIIRRLTALNAAVAGWFVIAGAWSDWQKATSPFCPAAPPACAAAWSAIYALEFFPRYVPFAIKFIPGSVVAFATSIPKLVELYKLQVDLIDTVPLLIEEQRVALEDYYDCDINLIRGDGLQRIEPPLKRGNPLTMAPVLFFRTFKELLNNEPMAAVKRKKFKPGKKKKDGSWNLEDELKWMLVGNGATWWTRGVKAMFVPSLLAGGFFHHVSVSTFGPIEYSPTVADILGVRGGWAPYTVLAAARKRSSDPGSATPAQHPMSFMAPGFFDASVSPVAYAQAETFNGIDGHLPWMLMPQPWRVWTPWGWSWEPRLSHGETTSIFPSLRGSRLPDVAGSLFTSPHDLGVSASGSGLQAITTH